MSSFKFKIILPSGTAFDAEVKSVSVTALDGDWGIYAHHAPTAAAVAPGTVRIVDAQGQRVEFKHGSGIMSVGADETEFLVTELEKPGL